MNVRFAGEYNDGMTALPQSVWLRFSGETLFVETDDGVAAAAWRLADVVGGDSGKGPLRLRLEPDAGERLAVRGKADVEAVRSRLAGVRRRARTRTRNRAMLGCAAAWLAAVALWFAWPAILTGAVNLIPYSWERSLGEGALETIARTISGTATGAAPWRADGPGDAAMAKLVSRLAPEAAERERFMVGVLETDMVNAFALPGGFIIATTGLIRHCRSADELAGVLAHEMAHATERHNMRHLLRDALTRFMFKIFSGGDENFVNSMVKDLIAGKLSREDERAADVLGARRLAAAKINPEAGALFFAGLEQPDKEGAVFDYFGSHPRGEERQESIRREAAAFSGPFTPALSDAEWRDLKRLAERKP